MAARLDNKVILITGAARGIGAATAECVAREGARLCLSDVDPGGEQVAARLTAEGARHAEFSILDVSEAASWATWVRDVLERHGRIDGLVNNAAIQTKYVPLEMPEASWDRCLEVNLRGAWHGSRAVLPCMLAQRAGAIVNIASVHGHRIIPGAFPYSVSKHGLIGLTRALGVEYAPAGVRINAISPGYVDTEPQSWDGGARSACEALIPARRIAEPREIGMSAVFLLSDEAPSIIASTLVIDGGRLALYHE